MLFVVSPLNPDPMYKQVTEQVRAAIAAGALEPETKLPSIREMSMELTISIITIKRAYADLERILKKGKTFDISSEDIVAVVKEMKEKQDG